MHFANVELANNGAITDSGSGDVGEFDLHAQVTFSSNIANYKAVSRDQHAVQYLGFLLRKVAMKCKAIGRLDEIIMCIFH